MDSVEIPNLGFLGYKMGIILAALPPTVEDDDK